MKSLALDTNLLLLLIIGRVAPAQIGRHARLKRFDRTHYNLLIEAISKARKLVTTAQCVTETSNLVVQGLYEPLRSLTRQGLKDWIENSLEWSVASSDAADMTEFIRLGITDAAWLQRIDNETTLLTADLELYNAATARRRNAVYFWHIVQPTTRE